MEGGQYRCAYCGHLSLPPRPVVDEMQRAANLQAILSQFMDARAWARGGARGERGAREASAGRRAASTRRVNGIVMLGIGGLFFLFALASFAVAVAIGFLYTDAPATHHAHVASHAPSDGKLRRHRRRRRLRPHVARDRRGPLACIGIRYRRAGGRDRRMREQGLRGRAVVKSYRESNLVVDGNRKFDLVLEGRENPPAARRS